ncbi:SIMPL domain-containing protein [Amylibacter ulvae]|uniref:SIMPL domain-containing protein n=1 Tax=Paramylibacter ulvae TaxID=1651968 RepID=A0ABQ3D4L3_9RHOB|nr:SIMPL domain-containing protein [Amylibacter ulvae]GHA58559.1 SIMPL domain-containing protein [Amylibacter ulvae]
MSGNKSVIIASLFLGAGIAAAGYFVSQTTLNERTGANTARVKGLSERVVQADTGRWLLSFSSFGRDVTQVTDVFEQTQAKSVRIHDILTAAGFSDDELRFTPLRKSDYTDRDNEGKIIDRYFLVSGSIQITTSEPQKIDPARQPIFDLAKDGIDVAQDSLRYEYTKLNDIKPDMLREATENARIAANEFASNAGVSVGGIQSASQGGFQIDAHSGSTSALDKLVRVVTNITFYLEN